MIWEPYIHPDPNIGNVTSVYLNKDKTLIKRYFIKDAITVSGNKTKHSEEYIDAKWKCEYSALIKFQDKNWVPELVEINESNRYTIQKYYGPDLLIQGFDDIPDIEDQVVNIYKYFKEINVYKFNGALSNMTKKDGRVIMFDFKYMRNRMPEYRADAITEINEWLSKISPTISDRLKELI